MWQRRSCGIELRKKHGLQRRVSKLLNKLPYGRQNQTNRHYILRQTSAVKSHYDVWITFARLRLVEIAFLFISFERLRLERNQILLDLDLTQIDLWHDRVSQQKSCFKSKRNELFGSRGGQARDKIAISLRTANQILIWRKISSKVKHITWECKQQIYVGDTVREEMLSRQYNSSIVFLRNNRWRFSVRIVGTLSL